MTHIIALSLGTNLGDKPANLRNALAALAEVMQVDAVSPIYETEPWGVTDQPTFLNLCATATSIHSPHTILQQLKRIEQTLGRVKLRHWGERLIDIDLLLYDDAVVDSETLQVPHAWMHERGFVLVPLADIAADWVHPIKQQTVSDLLAQVDTSGLKMVPHTIDV